MESPGSKTRGVFRISVLLVAIASSASARPVPQNSVNGLDKIVEYREALVGASNATRARGAKGNVLTSAQLATAALARAAAAYARMAITDSSTGKCLVEIMPDGSNNTYVSLGPAQDVPFDADTNYANFYGTRAASLHGAANAPAPAGTDKR